MRATGGCTACNPKANQYPGIPQIKVCDRDWYTRANVRFVEFKVTLWTVFILNGDFVLALLNIYINAVSNSALMIMIGSRIGRNKYATVLTVFSVRSELVSHRNYCPGH